MVLFILLSVISILILYISMSHMVGLPVIPFLNMITHPINYAISLLILTTIVILFGKDIIKNGYKKYKDAGIIAFYVDNVDKKFEKKKRKEGKINLITSMKIQSVQITFKRKSIIDKKIKFNELFGTGTELYSGEENIFLADCIRNN